MAEEMNRKDAAQEKLTDRNYVYVRYENDDDDEMDIYDIITLCKKGLLIAKRYIALLLVFFVLGGVVGFVKAKVFKEEKYTSTALLFVDLNRDVIDTSNDMNESSKISMLANSFSQIVSSDSVIAPIAKQYALDSEDIDVENEDAVNTKVDNLRENITVTVPSDTQTINVSVTDDDAERCQSICETIVDTGIKAMDSATNYATISIVSPASEGKKEKGEAAGAAASALTMAAIFLVVAILIVAVRELGIAYKAHEAAKQEEEKKN